MPGRDYVDKQVCGNGQVEEPRSATTASKTDKAMVCAWLDAKVFKPAAMETSKARRSVMMAP